MNYTVRKINQRIVFFQRSNLRGQHGCQFAEEWIDDAFHIKLLTVVRVIKIGKRCIRFCFYLVILEKDRICFIVLIQLACLKYEYM